MDALRISTKDPAEYEALVRVVLALDKEARFYAGGSHQLTRDVEVIVRGRDAECFPFVGLRDGSRRQWTLWAKRVARGTTITPFAELTLARLLEEINAPAPLALGGEAVKLQAGGGLKVGCREFGAEEVRAVIAAYQERNKEGSES